MNQINNSSFTVTVWKADIQRNHPPTFRQNTGVTCPSQRAIQSPMVVLSVSKQEDRPSKKLFLACACAPQFHCCGCHKHQRACAKPSCVCMCACLCVHTWMCVSVSVSGFIYCICIFVCKDLYNELERDPPGVMAGYSQVCRLRHPSSGHGAAGRFIARGSCWHYH